MENILPIIFAATVIAALVSAVWIDHRNYKRKLARMDELEELHHKRMTDGYEQIRRSRLSRN
jgi:hypothetical protein